MDDAIESLSDQRSSKEPAPLMADALLLTESMLELARCGDWEAVTRLEETRRAAIAKCFSKSVPEEQSDIFAEALAAMLQMNEELVSLLECAREEVAVKRTNQKYIKRAVTHYLDV